MHLLRRDFLLSGSAAALGAPSAIMTAAAHRSIPRIPALLFSKHLQFIKDYDRLVGTIAELGFDGIDLAVRPGAHVLPENAERDIPQVVGLARAAGLSVPMITTRIQDAADKHTLPILRTALAEGIKLYRIGPWYYAEDKSIEETLAEVGAQLAGLAELNAELGLRAAFQNHSGPRDVGASLWDLWEMMRELDPGAMGVNFDIGHATVEGGQAWETTLRLLESRIPIVTIKDFKWERSGDGTWKPEWCPLGDGMINLKRFLSMLREADFTGPVTLHFEYDPVDSQGRPSQEALLEAMRRDLSYLRQRLDEAGLN
jgi:sugar phosphate isomerase/epimerase